MNLKPHFSTPDTPLQNTRLENLESAMRAAGLGIWDLFLTEPWTMVLDERCKELFGFSLEQVAFGEVLQAIHSDDRDLVEGTLQKALDPSKDGNCDITFRIPGDEGILHWIRFICKRKDRTGNTSHLSGIAMDVSAEKLAFEKSYATESLAKAAINGTGVGLFHITFPDNHINYTPAFALILSGTNNKSLTRQEFINHIHPEDRQTRQAAYEAALLTGDLTYEARAVWVDETVHWIRTVGSYSFDEAGKPLSFSGTVQDITEQRQKEQALKEAEKRFSLALQKSEAIFRNVTSTAPTGLWMSDDTGAFIYLNKTLTDWTGMPYELLLGRGWVNIIIDDDRVKAVGAFDLAIARQQHYDVEFRIRKGSNEVIWCRSAGEPYYLEDGVYGGHVGFCMDINDRVIASDKLKQNEERLRTIIEQAPVAIALLNGRDMIIETANDAIVKLWSKDRSVIGRPIADAIPELEGQPFVDLLNTVYKTGEPYYGYNALTKLKRNGALQDLYFDLVYTPIKNAYGAITGVMVLATEVTEQVLARKTVEDSEAMFRSLVEEAPVATALYNGDRLIIEMANDAMIKLWGKEKSVIGMPLRDALPELEGQSFLTILDDVFTTGLSYHTHEARADLLVNGMLNSFYFNFTYKPLRNNRGEIYAILNMAVDVTEQVFIRKKIEESELFSRSIIENSPVAKIVFVSESMVISTVNEKMLEMLGRNTSIIGRSFRDAIPEVIQATWMERLTHVITTGETFYQSEEKIELDRSGKLYTGYYSFIYKAIPNTSGEFYGVIVTGTDITDQVLARHKILEAEEALRGAVELAELGTWKMDLATGILDYSPRLRNWFGFDEFETITIEKVYRAVAEGDRYKVRESLKNAAALRSQSSYDIEYNIIDKTGNERILHAQGRPFFNEKGEPYKLSGTAQDVTKQRKIQMALEQEVQKRTEELQAVNEELTATNEELNLVNNRLMYSNEELAQYAYVASHDLQEPLRKIRIYSDMLDNQEDLSDENKHLVAKIGQSSERMTLLIRDLLEFSRLLKTDTLMSAVDLSAVVNAVVEDFELSIKEKNAIIQVSNLPLIEGVALQMNQLFYNLLSNALKFAAAGKQPNITIGSVAITPMETRKYIQNPLPFSTYYRITFTDNGIGFDPQYVEQIFEVFKRLHGRNVYPGSGIGLALCRRIIANHHGHLYAESQPGEFTSFYIIIPDKQQHHESRWPENSEYHAY